MALEDELTDAFINAYQAAGRDVGYWGRRFLQSVRNNGALATARRMLLPRNASQRKGLDALLEANRPELSVESIVLQRRFRSLFTRDELSAANQRLAGYRKTIRQLLARRERLYPDELELGRTYVEGAKKQVRVNAYERNPKARAVCLKHYGVACVVCGVDFAKRYGRVGEGFIHVHHLMPIALTSGKYELDPIADLRPVCPNCHAMLHRREPPLSIDKLRSHVLRPGG